jgi:hypothetical protein
MLFKIQKAICKTKAPKEPQPRGYGLEGFLVLLFIFLSTFKY